MSELKQILDLARRANAAKEDLCLATVVGIEGSAYRRPGARMLLTAPGLRAGTVSGGCLEGEIAKKAWWLTEKGPALQRYTSFFDDDGDMPYGLGCGGTVIVQIERGEPAAACLGALRRSVEDRLPSVIVSAADGDAPGTLLILRDDGSVDWQHHEDAAALELAREVLAARSSRCEPGWFAEYINPPQALWIFGAGDDAQPLVEFAAALGWHVIVADGRSQLLRHERFPQAAQVITLGNALGGPQANDAAVIMTHSYEQDREALRALLPLGIRYLGILGPRARTGRLAGEIAPALGLSSEACLARLHSPVGLDLGGHSPATIALSVVAEIQALLAGRQAKAVSAAAEISG